MRKLPGLQIADGIWVGRNNAIHPSVRLQPPVFIGDNCRIGREVELGPEAVISQNVIIDDEATIYQSAVLDHTYVGQLVNVENRFVNKKNMIDVETGQNTEVTDHFLLDEAAPTTIGLNFLAQFGSPFCPFVDSIDVAIYGNPWVVRFVNDGALFSKGGTCGNANGLVGRRPYARPLHV